MSIRVIFKNPLRCFECWINYFWERQNVKTSWDFHLFLSIYWKFFESYDLSLIINISVTTQSILTCWGCFGILRTSRFQNCPWVCIYSSIWRRYWGFTPLKVMLATTVYIKKMKIVGAWAVSVICEQDSERCEEFRMLSLAFLHK